MSCVWTSCKHKASGFTLLEVMVAMAIIAIALVAVFRSQSQSVSMASEAKFVTTAALLAQSKMTELEAKLTDDLMPETGDFGEDFPDYTWEMDVNEVSFEEPENVSNFLKQVDLVVTWGASKEYEFPLRLYRFSPKEK